MESKKEKIPPETVLAAQLNEARETIISLRIQLQEQNELISKLSQKIATFEIQAMRQENQRLRTEHKLEEGQQFIKENGEWFKLSKNN